jgi:hypothetical protein
MTATPPPAFPEKLLPLRAELAVYYRELPRLLEEGEAGRYVVAKGDVFHGVWDTFRDARQYGYAMFGLEQFLTQVVDDRYLAVLEQWFGPLPAPTDEAA